MSGTKKTKIFILILFFLACSDSLFARDDICKDSGIVVFNSNHRDLWYKKKDISCTNWEKHKLITVKEGDNLSIYTNSSCKNNYCLIPGDVTVYEHFRSFDSNHNCRIKLLSGCSLTDM